MPRKSTNLDSTNSHVNMHSLMNLLLTSNFSRHCSEAVEENIVQVTLAVPAILSIVLGMGCFSLRRDGRYHMVPWRVGMVVKFSGVTVHSVKMSHALRGGVLVSPSLSQLLPHSSVSWIRDISIPS
jgi:hypothetical protein